MKTDTVTVCLITWTGRLKLHMKRQQQKALKMLTSKIKVLGQRNGLACHQYLFN